MLPSKREAFTSRNECGKELLTTRLVMAKSYWVNGNEDVDKSQHFVTVVSLSNVAAMRKYFQTPHKTNQALNDLVVITPIIQKIRKSY